MSIKGPGSENELSKKSAEMKIHRQLDNRDWGKVKKLVARKVSDKERGGTGKFYGSRAIITKEQVRFADHLLVEMGGFTEQQRTVALSKLRQLTDGLGDVAIRKVLGPVEGPGLIGYGVPASAWKTQRIPVSELHPTQSEVESKWVEAVLNDQGRTSGAVKVVVIDGKRLILDGHHRVVACALAGINEVEAHVAVVTGVDDNFEPTFEAIVEDKKSFINHLIEGSDYSAYPDSVIAEIKKNIGKGAKDLAQNWKDALELVNKAFQVANVRRPTPNDKAAWKQYEALIQHGVRELAKTRGLSGNWRTSTMLVREDAPAAEQHIGKRRFFVEIPGESAVEAEGANMDEIIDQIANKMRRHGAKVRVEERTKTYAVLSVWVNDIKRDRVIVKEVS